MTYSTLISPAGLAALLDGAGGAGSPRTVVVDVRHDLAQPERWGEEQYRASRIPGARFAHLDRDLSGPKTGRNGRHPLPSPGEATALFGRLGIDAGTQVVAYDQGPGMFAARLWWMLRWLGHEAAAVLDGGFARWQREGHPAETGEIPGAAVAVERPGSGAAAPRVFVPRVTLPTASVQDVLDSLPTHARFVVDARAPERFRGEVEPLDPVAGHIPGAHNWPHARNVEADGRFKPAAELAGAFAEFLGPTPPEHVVHHCGSGVTACHNILAMMHAGYPATTLFPGSWSEWVADPSRPVATGRG